MNRYSEFILTETLESKFVNFLNDTGIAIISAASRTGSPERIKRFHKKGENIFWNKAYLVREEDIPNINMAYAKSCSHYVVEDTYEAPVIEFRKNSMDGRQNAWIFASLSYDRDGHKKFKGQEFESLYKIIETWINNNCDVIDMNYSL